jgi:hypothetical protein
MHFMKIPALSFLISCLLVLLIESPCFAIPIQQDGFTTGDNVEAMIWSPTQITGQTWTATFSYQAVYIDILMGRTGTPGDIVLVLRNTSGDNPATTNLAMVQLAVSNIGESPGWVRFNLPLVNIGAGVVYFWGVYALSGDSNANFYNIRCNTKDAFAGGSQKKSIDGGMTWLSPTGQDHLFKVFNDTSLATTPPLTTSAAALPITTAVTTVPPATTPKLTFSPTQTLATTNPAATTNIAAVTPALTPTTVTVVITTTVPVTTTFTNSQTSKNSSLPGIIMGAAGGLILGLTLCRFVISRFFPVKPHPVPSSGTIPPPVTISESSPPSPTNMPSQKPKEADEKKEEEKRKKKKLIIYESWRIQTYGKKRDNRPGT